jgi:hypothetical protein
MVDVRKGFLADGEMELGRWSWGDGAGEMELGRWSWEGEMEMVR